MPPKLRRRGQSKNEVHFGAHELLFKMTGVDITRIEGIDESTALVLMSELGFDMNARFPTRPSGGPKAIVATARKIAIRLYRLLKFGTEYVRQEMTAYEATYRLKVTKGLAKRTEELGYRLVPVTPTA